MVFFCYLLYNHSVMEYTQEIIHEIVNKQKSFFAQGNTLPLKFRIEALKKLKASVLKYQKELENALHDDLGRSECEAFFCDIGTVILEINEAIHGLRKWARPETHFSGLQCFPSIITKVYKMPYGVTLIISPFNFPILLSLGVLTASIAAGNTAMIKCSSKSANCTRVMQDLIKDAFDEQYITVIDGGHDVADFCLNEKVDKIFYTGSPNVAKHVMELASKNLTPVALELGGETGNWAIVRKDANIKDAARKIAFFKICNSGQICINVNQVAVAKEVAPQFIEELKKEIIRQIGNDPIHNEEYPHLIAKRAYESCEAEALLYKDRIVFGGVGDKDTLKYSPTIIYPVNIDEPIVNHELFCPLLPVVEFEDDKVNDLLNVISSREKGLAFYLFTKDKKWAKKTMQSMQYGGGCVNEICLHMMVKGVPFNGVGHSGLGAYHGEWGFKEFSHPSSVLFGKTHFNLSLREHPYSQKKKNLFRKFLK